MHLPLSLTLLLSDLCHPVNLLTGRAGFLFIELRLVLRVFQARGGEGRQVLCSVLGNDSVRLWLLCLALKLTPWIRRQLDKVTNARLL